jgi:hypothetical protein
LETLIVTNFFSLRGCSKRSRVMTSPYETSRWHSDTHHSLSDSSGRAISLTQRPLTTHNTHNSYPCPPAVFEPTIPASEWPQSHALDRAATAIGSHLPLGLPNGVYCSSFPQKLWIHSWHQCVPHAQSISSSLILIVIIILGADYNSWSPSLCSFLQYPPQSTFFPLCGRPILRLRKVVKCVQHKWISLSVTHFECLAASEGKRSFA